MKIEYDVELYKKIAQLSLNEVVVTTNRKGRRKTIHITNITKLTWQELQLLVGDGQDKFTKMVLLFNKYYSGGNTVDSGSRVSYKGKELSSGETREIDEYIKIYKENNCTEHHEVNSLITINDRWDEFPTIRSLNDHSENKNIKGILPKYFEIVCTILKISGDTGKPLDKATHY
jgi:hypothetical protein